MFVHIIHTARKLNTDYLSEWRPNCVTIREQYENEPPAEETISQSEPQLQNTDVGPLHRDEASAATSAAEHQQPEPSQTSTRNRKQPYRY